MLKARGIGRQGNGRFGRVVGKPRTAAQMRPFLGPGDDIDMREVFEVGHEPARLRVCLGRIDRKIHPADAPDDMVAVLRPGAAQRDIGIAPRQIGEVEAT